MMAAAEQSIAKRSRAILQNGDSCGSGSVEKLLAVILELADDLGCPLLQAGHEVVAELQQAVALDAGRNVEVQRLLELLRRLRPLLGLEEQVAHLLVGLGV